MDARGFVAAADGREHHHAAARVRGIGEANGGFGEHAGHGRACGFEIAPQGLGLIAAARLVTSHGLQEQRLLVAEGRVQARPIEPGRFGKLVERGAGEAFFDEDVAYPPQHVFRREAARPAARAPDCLFNHFCTDPHKNP